MRHECDEAAHADSVADFELAHLVPHGRHNSSDFVARNHGKDGFLQVVGPFPTTLMDIGVANPAVLDVDGDIVLLRLAPFDTYG